MRLFIYFFASCLLTVGLSQVHGQTTGRYDVRFVVQSLDCTANTLTVDLQVKASDNDSTFNMGDQNYKFTYNRQAIDLINAPGSVTELGYSGVLKVNPSNPNSLFQPYGPHTLIKIDPGTGSIALGILNIVWQPGRNGILVEDTGWSPVSRLQFNIIDPSKTQCLNLVWRDQSNSTHFTNITEVEALPPAGSASTQPFSTTTDASEKLYLNENSCLDILCNPTFPVEWTGFDVVYKGAFSEVTWTTAQEVNNDYFVVERSLNGNSFSQLGRVEAKGSNSEYRFEDREINSLRTQRVYYRVRQIDVDGGSTGTDVVELVLTGKVSVVGVYPNPAKNYVTLQVDASDLDAVTISIVDPLGRVVRRVNRTMNGRNETTVDVKTLPQGTYIVRVHDGLNSATAKFMIVR